MDILNGYVEIVKVLEVQSCPKIAKGKREIKLIPC